MIRRVGLKIKPKTKKKKKKILLGNTFVFKLRS